MQGVEHVRGTGQGDSRCREGAAGARGKGRTAPASRAFGAGVWARQGGGGCDVCWGGRFTRGGVAGS